MRTALVTFREDKKLTQEQVANLVGVSRSYYCELELGTKSPSLELLGRFIEVFGPKTAEIFLPIIVASCDNSATGAS